MNDVMVRLEGVSKTYQQRPTLQNLTLKIAPGEVYGLLGPNGAGKTTTINLICGLLKADSGAIYLKGQPVSHATKPLVGIVPQENLLYRSLTCAENLWFIGQLYGLSRRQCRERTAECLAAVNLSDRARSIVQALSGGMQRRLSIAAALIHQPQLMILDEPTTGLDIESRYEVMDLITQLTQAGTTVLLTTHLLNQAERLCHRLGILVRGRLLAEGTLAELRRLVPAQEIVTLTTPTPERALERVQQDFDCRCSGTQITFGLPHPLELKELLGLFDGIVIDAIARQPVGLEHIYLEVTRQKLLVPSSAADSERSVLGHKLPG